MGSDTELVEALRRRDEAAFVQIVDGWGPDLLRMARVHVPSRAVAEEVVQETWLAVFRGLDGYEARGPLRAWVFGILLNLARTHGRRERRTQPFSSLLRRRPGGDAEGTVEPSRFQGRRGERPGWWTSPPSHWTDPEARLEAAATRAVLGEAISSLPPRQREVLVLRDVLGVSAQEARTVVGATEGNQRVLLHRARARVRAALERHMDEGGVA